MNRREADRSDESAVFLRPVDSELVAVRRDGSHENIEMRQLRVLFISIAGLIVADVLVLIYFWTI